MMMIETAHAALGGWESFYVIAGSSAAALIGLQFVVLVLIADVEMPGNESTIATWGTPSVMHLVGTLIISAIMSAPWPSLSPVAVALGLTGLGGLGYEAIVIRRARDQSVYKPVFEDWVWHTMLPTIAYAATVVGGMLLLAHAVAALFTVGAAALALLLIAIHNAWDTVVYIVLASQSAKSGNQGENQTET